MELQLIEKALFKRGLEVADRDLNHDRLGSISFEEVELAEVARRVDRKSDVQRAE
jgi:hypothetical protein